MIVYTFPKGSLFFGPSQVNAMIDQDTRVSGQLTLWNQLGSQVERGRITVVPVAGSIVYIQPVYLKASGRLRIPQLKRLIICKNETVVMEPTLEEGFAKLEERFQAQSERSRRRLQELSPGPGDTRPPGPPGGRQTASSRPAAIKTLGRIAKSGPEAQGSLTRESNCPYLLAKALQNPQP